MRGTFLQKQTCVVLALLLAACELRDPQNPELTVAAPRNTAKREVPIMSKPLDAELQAMVDNAVVDLVKRGGAEPLAADDPEPLAADDIEVLQAERVTWRSSAAGCPLPDRAYLMVLTPGVRIVLRAAGTEFEYHATRTGTPFLCEPPAKIETPAPGPSSLDPT